MKDKRLGIYVGYCPDCDSPMSLVSADKGVDMFAGGSVGAAVALGSRVEFVSIEDYKANPVKLMGCQCEDREQKGCKCAYCGDPIIGEVEYCEQANEFGFIFFTMHKDCLKKADKTHYDDASPFPLIDSDWGNYERDEACKERDRQLANGQMELF